MYTLANAGSASSLKVAHFVCNVRAAVLVLIPSEFVSVLTGPQSQLVFFRVGQDYFGRKKKLLNVQL